MADLRMNWGNKGLVLVSIIILSEEQMVRNENELNTVLALIKKRRRRRGFSEEQPLSTFNVVLAVFRYHTVNLLNPLSCLAQLLTQTLMKIDSMESEINTLRKDA